MGVAILLEMAARRLHRWPDHWLRHSAASHGLCSPGAAEPRVCSAYSSSTLHADYHRFGLYTSFTGAVTYWIFGTSKDIVIGTTAVGSLLVGSVISHVEESRPGVYSRPEIAKALSFVTGSILLLVGLLRLGWIVEFIPYVPVSAFVTAASITIMSTQFPVAMGITGINTRESPYKVIINTLRGLPRTQLDAAIGLSCIVILFVIRDVCAKLEQRQPHRKRMWSTISSLRQFLAMFVFTLISFLVHRTLPRGEMKFRLVGHISVGQYTIHWSCSLPLTLERIQTGRPTTTQQ
jgi:solute carrier family 26 (sodium-independent sulfate anion transporter), member 11